jgi:hypothetical protein
LVLKIARGGKRRAAVRECARQMEPKFCNQVTQSPTADIRSCD